MNTELIRGKDTIASIKADIKEKLSLMDTVPNLAIVRVGQDPDDIYYQNSVQKKCEEMGINLEIHEFPEDVQNPVFLKALANINDDNNIDGILLLRPLPSHLYEQHARNLISIHKDIDAMSPFSLAKIFEGDDTGFAPCTAEAVMRILAHEKIDISGKDVVIIGRSIVVGKPLSMMMLGQNATITICHTRTKDIQTVCKRADILVCAAGKAKMVDKEYVKPGAILIDVGINVDEDGKMCGDVDAESVMDTASALTPVPGGVGGVTSWLLIEHVARAKMMMDEVRSHNK